MWKGKRFEPEFELASMANARSDRFVDGLQLSSW